MSIQCDIDITRAEGYHVPVLLKETVEGVLTRPNGIYIDATLGGGGHSRALLSLLAPEGHLFGLDRDADAQQHNTITDPRFTFVRTDFRYLAHFMDYYGIDAVDGIIADLGVSSHHLDDEQRGFSFRFDAPIDMRMCQEAPRTAADLLRECSTQELAHILKEYGEVKGNYRIAQALTQAREEQELQTINDLLNAIQPVCPKEDKKNLARIFQALRIVVNDELGALEALLEEGSKLLRPGGRMAIITYHSLEDRRVKNFFRNGNLSGTRQTDLYGVPLSHMEPATAKPILPSSEEQSRNPRSRSAKLRIGIRQ